MHAIERGTAAAYILSGGGDSMAALEADDAASFEALGEDGVAIAESFEKEKAVQTEEEFAALMETQMPLHFAGPVPPNFCAATRYAPEVLRHFASTGYGGFDYTPTLGRVTKPTLVMVGEEDRTTTPRAARVLHEGIRRSELVVLPGAAHVSYVEAQDAYLDAVRAFFAARCETLLAPRNHPELAPAARPVAHVTFPDSGPGERLSAHSIELDARGHLRSDLSWSNST
jgi:pimeloyl-ACP methyl ester carboxylesterase